MIDWPLVLIVLAAVVVLGGLLGLAAWWYLPPVDRSGPDSMPAPRAVELHTEDDEWAARLHEINLAVSHKVWSWFQQKMVPVSEVTHYEVEALIRTLAVPEWVPDRYRVAA